MQMREITSSADWENFLLGNSPDSLFQSWTWGDVQQKLGNKVFRYGWYTGSGLAAIAQATLVRARRGTFLHIRHGPIVRHNDASLWKDVMLDLAAAARQQHAWFIRVSPLLLDTEATRVLLREQGGMPAAIHAMDAELCWVLNLQPTADELLKAMRKTTRYEIRRAQSLGVTVEHSRSVDDLNYFFRLYDQTVSRHGFVGHRGITEEFQVFGEQDQAVLLLGKHEGTVLAAAVILFYGGQAIYHHGASVSSKVPASYLVQWDAIQLAKQRNCTVYNFWGIADEANPNHPWKGLSLFKKGFGGSERRYVHAHDVPLHPFYMLPRAVEQIRKRMKGY